VQDLGAIDVAHDPMLDRIRLKCGVVDYRRTLADIIRMNTGVGVRADVFKVPRPTSG
jgi:hypothetical protein